MRSAILEREVKLGVWPGFRLPELDDVIDGATTGPVAERRLEATYLDTPDYRLARSGVSLRFRSGDGSGWTLKLPDDTPTEGGLSRTEMTFDGEAKSVPTELATLLTAWVRTSTLVPVARLNTLRRSRDLLDADGEVLVEVVDDEVSVLDGRRVAVRFREVEVELAPDAPDEALVAVIDRLRQAGAGAPDPTTKVQRALGPVAAGPPDLVELVPGPEATAAEGVTAALTRSVRRLLAHDLGVRLGEDPEDVHQARVATRRLRSDLRTYGELVDRDWAEGLRGDLATVAAALGGVRDADVLLQRLGRQLDELHPDDRGPGERLLAVLEDERGEARRQLLELLDGKTYAALLDRLVAGARNPALLEGAAAPAAAVLPGLVRRPWKQLVDAVAAVEPDGPDEELHEVRIRAKRCRYAAEVAALTAGRPALRFAREVAALQEVLGDHQDAVVTEDWLRRTARGVDAPVAFVAGELAAASKADADAGRDAWEAAWARASRGKLRTWMRSG